MSDRIAVELVRVARELVGGSIGRKWESRGPIVVVRWVQEVLHGRLDDIRDAFRDVDRVSKREADALASGFGVRVVPPMARMYASKDKMFVGADIAFEKRYLSDNYHRVLMDWERSGKVVL